jgi:DNA mismatch repair protein MutL
MDLSAKNGNDRRGPIKVLPEHIANQIAAGEVVEGPSSIIKELVENSIDATASKVDVIVAKNFLRVQVIDNGHGMSKDDLSLAFKKHATSKITSIEDLHNLMTKGFRGEALASISAVSKLTCISKRSEDTHASKIYLENGIETITETGASVGTNVLVDELFFNTPARLKFLKSNTKERNNIIDLCRGLALSHPELALSLTIDSKTIFASSGSAQLELCIQEVFKDNLDKALSKIDFMRDGLKVEGYASSPHVSRSDKRGIFTIVNGRLLQCYILRSAVEAVYKEILGPGKYPICVIKLNLPLELVDINVHPNKKEVRYSNTNQIYTLVGDAVAKALADHAYETSSSFQPSLKEHYLRNEESSLQQVSFNSDLVNNSDKFVNTQSKAYKNDFSIVNQAKNQAAMEIIESHFEASPQHKKFRDDFSFEHNDVLNANTRKFISRFGSADISVLDSVSLDTVMSSLGNKTSFELVTKDEDIHKSVLIRGDFIGENWIKDHYFEFLAKLAKEILEREKLEKNFKVKNDASISSRPQAKPSDLQLKEIWKRDYYTCVYCHKLLLDPDTIKTALKTNSDPEKLNSHLASYDHHLPASKFQALNQDSRNLYASCQACNKQKSDSLASKTWTPNPHNAWKNNHLEIANEKFTSPKL